MSKPKVYTMPFSKVYSCYVDKAERKGRTKSEVDEIIRWLTGYDQAGLESQLASDGDFENFFAEAPHLNPLRSEIRGVVCGIRVEAVEEQTMREIRYLDKLVDDLARGKTMATILRT